MTNKDWGCLIEDMDDIQNKPEVQNEPQPIDELVKEAIESIDDLVVKLSSADSEKYKETIDLLKQAKETLSPTTPSQERPEIKDMQKEKNSDFMEDLMEQGTDEAQNVK